MIIDITITIIIFVIIIIIISYDHDHTGRRAESVERGPRVREIAYSVPGRVKPVTS